MSGKTLIKIRNDAISCFDRMILNIISLCSRIYDIPDELCTLQVKNTTNNEIQSVDSTRNIQITLSTFYNKSHLWLRTKSRTF